MKEVKIILDPNRTGEFRHALKTLLEDSICKVYWDKTDGELGEMKCTLQPEYLPPLKEGHKRKENLDVLPVWKLGGSTEGWRSFRIDSVRCIEVLYDK